MVSKPRNKFSVLASNLKATIGEIEYEWFGGFGAVLISYERRVKKNEVRVIGGEIFYAYNISGSEPFSFKRRISWSPQQAVDIDWIRDFKAAIFGT